MTTMNEDKLVLQIKIEEILDENEGDEIVDEDEAVDPRVQIELEKLNTATDEINRLETELDEERAKFRNLMNDATTLMRSLMKKVGKDTIEKSRSYFMAVAEAKQANAEAQKATREFQRANSIYAAARETISMVELRMLDSEEKRDFDSACQEALNHVTMKVMEAEREKTRSESEHLRTSAMYNEIVRKRNQLERKYKRSIGKARSYFETKEKLNFELEEQKEKIEALQRCVLAAKQMYSQALHNLEKISDEVHERRKKKEKIARRPREPGVGAEMRHDKGVEKAAGRGPGWETMHLNVDIDVAKWEVCTPRECTTDDLDDDVIDDGNNTLQVGERVERCKSESDLASCLVMPSINSNRV